MRYRIDSIDRISEVDEEWLRFAAENEAPSLTPDAVRGRSLYSFISDATTSSLWHDLLVRVRGGSHLDLEVHCDGPTTVRLIRIRAVAEPDGSVRFTTDVLRTTARASVPVPPASSSNGPLVLCSWCQRLLVPGADWVDLEEGIARLDLFGGMSPGLISHGICPSCYSGALADCSMQESAGA
jgi:hypothetical protein